MAYSIWDKQPDLVLPKIPFEFLAGLAEKRDKQLDEVDTKLGKIKGEFASLVAAPGHEDLATGLATEYNKKVTDWYDKYKSNPLSREGSRELTSLGVQFANDQRVQTVVKSRQFYEKFEPKMWEEMSKRSYIDAPGILNTDGTFNQNTQTYDMSKFQLTPQADYIKSIQEQYNIKKEAKFQSSETKPLGVDAEGHPIYKTEDYQRIWNDPENRKETALAIEKMVWDNTTSDAGLIYLRKTAERQYPNDPQAQKAFVRESIKNAGVPFDFDWEETKESTKIDTTGTSKPKKGDEPTAPPGIITNISLDLLEDPNTGAPIRTAGALDQAVQNLNSKITTLKGSIEQTYPEIAAMVTAKEDPYIIDNQSGFEVLDVNKVAKKLGIEKDPIAMAQLNEKNIELMNSQVRRNGYYEKQAEFMGKAGLNPNLTLDEQVPEPLKVEAHQEAIYETVNNLPSFWGLPNPFDSKYVKKSVNSLTGVVTDISESILTGKPIKTKQDLEAHFEAYYKMLEGTKDAPSPYAALFAKRKDAIDTEKNKFLTTYSEIKDEYYKENDARYRTYADLVEKDLLTPATQQAFNYFLSGDAYTSLKRMAIAAAHEGKFDRAKWDDTKPAFKYSGEEGTEAKEKVLPQSNMKLWEDATYSIRYDNDSDSWVVDANTAEGTFEIPDVSQGTLASFVTEMDPGFTNKYLGQQRNFFSQMDQSNGRYAAVASPGKDVTDYIVVKSTTEDHGDVKKGDYVFMLPGFEGKVFTTKSFYHLNQLMQYYNVLKESGADANRIAAELATRKQNGILTFNQVDSKYSGIGSKYFASKGSRGYSVKK